MTKGKRNQDALRSHAAEFGIATSYRDTAGRERGVPDTTLSACLAAMGVEPGKPASGQTRGDAGYSILPAGSPVIAEGVGNAAWTLRLEDGGEMEGRGPVPSLPMGRHLLRTGERSVWILATPPPPDLPPRRWGLTAPLYGLGAPDQGGIGRYSDLGVAARAVAETGAAFLGINPVHAGFGFDPVIVSPYSPSHRRRLSVIHIDVAGEWPLPPRRHIDYPAALAARQGALLRAFRADPEPPGFDAYLADSGADLRRFAIHQAIAARHGPFWTEWPASLQGSDSPEVHAFAGAHPEQVRFHQWLQFAAHSGLSGAAETARKSGMSIGLYLDLAVGTHPHGAETWEDPRSFANGVSLGAPPDAFSESGQNWTLAPLNPRALQDRGFATFAETLRAQLRYAGMLRIDHILGIDRAYWVPEDGGPGTYVAMPKPALLAVIAIEAARAGAVIVGEDLGNIPKGLAGDLARTRILGSDVLMFDPLRPPQADREAALLTFGTHDLPTWEGWRRGRDIDARRATGSLDPAEAGDARQARARDVADFDRALGVPRPSVGDLVHRLGRSRARLVALQAEDILGLVDQPNLPGTTDSYPNWRQKLPVDPAGIGTDARITEAARILASCGRSDRESTGPSGSTGL